MTILLDTAELDNVEIQNKIVFISIVKASINLEPFFHFYFVVKMQIILSCHETFKIMIIANYWFKDIIWRISSKFSLI